MIDELILTNFKEMAHLTIERCIWDVFRFLYVYFAGEDLILGRKG